MGEGGERWEVEVEGRRGGGKVRGERRVVGGGWWVVVGGEVGGWMEGFCILNPEIRETPMYCVQERQLHVFCRLHPDWLAD